MILEMGRIIAIEPQGLWVETIQLSGCNTCRAQKSCGQSMLTKVGKSASTLWVLLEGRDVNRYSIGDEVQIGLPEEVITREALFMYMVPLCTLLAATVLAHQQAINDSLVALCAILGLILGAILVRWRAQRIRFDRHLQPVLVDTHEPLLLISSISH
jgi:sigma-E factor negative regulatory protein RseC